MSCIEKINIIRMYSIRIAMIIAIAMAAASNSCFFGSKTTLCETSGRRCEPGQTCAAKQDACITIGGCGDGIIDAEKGEICDDGNILDGDGCSADCKSDEKCGNGIVDVAIGESCDGNIPPGVHCSPTCVIEGCGNGIVDAGEDCDTGGIDTPDCDSDCTFVKCGDGHTNPAAGEICDSSGAITSACNGLLCTAPRCGDNFFNPDSGEECDTGESDTIACNGNRNVNGIGNCHIPKCGDGYINIKFIPLGTSSTEGCDNGTLNNNTEPDACRMNCQKASCGDGVRDLIVTADHPKEDCDDGDMNHDLNHDGKINSDRIPDACRTNCKMAFCGDGVLDTVITADHSKEDCDDGDMNHDLNHDGKINSDRIPDACRTNCKMAFCGDGVLDTVTTADHDREDCDNGDANHDLNHDGKINSDKTPDACRTNCQKAHCGDGVVDSNEMCEPNPDIINDGCPAGKHCRSCQCEM